MFSHIFFIILLIATIACGIFISIADFRRRIIPDAYLFPMLLITLTLIAFYSFPLGIQDAVIGALFGYILGMISGLLFDYYLSKRTSSPYPPIGMGDIKLLGVGGLWLGIDGMGWALIIACIFGAIWARNRAQKYIPFAPFFFIGGFLSFIAKLFLL